ncbi:MAG: hypothetical protein WAK48_07625 [Candidatus Acidiferrum sp.]
MKENNVETKTVTLTESQFDRIIDSIKALMTEIEIAKHRALSGAEKDELQRLFVRVGENDARVLASERP